MRVAFIVDRFPAASETFVLDQLTGLIELGHEVDVYARSVSPNSATGTEARVEPHGLPARTAYFGPPAGWLRRLAGSLSIIVRDLPKHPSLVVRALDPRRGGREVLSLRTLYAAHRFAGTANGAYDVLHCHFGPNGIIGLNVKRALGLRSPVVTSFYGYDVSHGRWARSDGPYGWLFREGDLFTALSDDMGARLEALGCPAERIVKHPLGVKVRELSLRVRKPREDGRVVLLTVARLIEKKGLEYSIRAVARLAERYPGIEYRIAGDGPLRARLERLAGELGVAGSVSILGWLDRQAIREQLDEADIFVLASVTAEDGDQEGTPTALLEAQAVGLPAVSTRHAGIPEILEDGRAGYLVPERDVDALFERLAHLVEHPELWAALGRAGRQYVEAYHDTDELSARLASIYARLAGDTSDRPNGPIEL